MGYFQFMAYIAIIIKLSMMVTWDKVLLKVSALGEKVTVIL